MKHTFLKYLLWVCLLFPLGILAQGVNDDGSSSDSSPGVGVGLPQVTPTNPETASLGRFGNVPINTATGQMSFSIPIHTISVDGHSWPIALSYNYGGMILESQPSMSGLGWGLSAYGSVNRETRGLPDGHPNGYYGANNRKDLLDAYVNGGFNDAVIPMDDFLRYQSGEYDTEVDKYMVNVGGMRFSFKLRYENNEVVPYFLTEHNYKVEVEMSSSEHFTVASFIVTDDRGIRYYFNTNSTAAGAGNLGHTEYRAFVDDGELNSEDLTSAWLLSQIKYPNGELINFHYNEETYRSWSFSASGYTARADIAEDNINGPVTFDAGYNDAMSHTDLHRQVIDRIDFPMGSVHFHSSNNGEGHRLYNSIEVKDANANIVDTYILTHQYSRDQLTRVDKNGELFYGFTYHQGVPGFFEDVDEKPLSQDFWKFYNGSNNDYALNLAYNGITADKSPSFAHTQAGAMKTISYPTGGSTNIFYEPNQKKVTNDTGATNSGGLGSNTQILLKLDVDSSTPIEQRESSLVYTFEYPVYVSTFIYSIEGGSWSNYTQVSIKRIDGGSSNYVDPEYVGCYTNTPPFSMFSVNERVAYLRSHIREECEFYPRPILTPVLIYEDGPEQGPEPTISLNDSSTGFWIQPGTYRFLLTAIDPVTGNSFVGGEPVSSRIWIRFHDPQVSNTPNDQGDFEFNENVGGIRVARIEDYPVTGEATSRSFDYNDDKGLSTGRLNHEPLERIEHSWTYYGNPFNPDSNFVGNKEATQFKLNAFSFLNEADGIPIYYNRVTTNYSGIGEDEYVFVPINLVDLLEETGTANLPNNQNPDGSQIVTYTGSSGTAGNSQYPNWFFNEDGVPGYLTRTYKRGYTVEHYNLPEESTDYKFPGLPDQYDDSKAVLRESRQYGQQAEAGEAPSTFVTSRTTNDYFFLRYFTSPDPDENGQDYNDEHPWSFRISKQQHLTINYNLHCYCNPLPTDPIEIAALKDLYQIDRYREVGGRSRVTQSETRHQGVTQIQQYDYDNLNQLEKQTTISGDGGILEQQFYYPYTPSDAGEGESQYIAMTTDNQISQPVLTISKRDGVTLSRQKTHFSELQPDMHKPVKVSTAKGDDTYEDRLLFEEYDSKGHIRQVRQADGTAVSYLWGYDQQYLVAKIEGATYLDALAYVPGYLGSFQNLDGQGLRDALQPLRNGLSNALITTYTYKPLVGVSSVTDPRGNTLYYEYDAQNRLIQVTDRNGEIISQNEYNYSTSN